jgi:hypothetical protein
VKDDLSPFAWYIGELVMEITVSGATSNVVHRNMVLIKAIDSQEAYEKAMQMGLKAETSYQNPEDQLVRITFRGISKLDAMYEEIEDGSELTFEEQIGLSANEIEQLITPKERLRAFVTPQPGKKHDPDYRSKEVMHMAIDYASNERSK